MAKTNQAADALTTAAASINFDRDIRPIFASRCYECHGPKKQKSGFRLDSSAAAMRGGDSGKSAITPGNSEASQLVHRLVSTDPEEVMPPKGEKLSPQQIGLIKRWIDAGAPWPEETRDSKLETQKHWSFRVPQCPVVPKVKNHRWMRGPLDAFVLARLEREGITPSPEADRPTLIRRLSLDLIGLPPTPEQVEAFVRDRSYDACDRLVDRLLASPHFGERWGRHWLDLARYADSEGYQVDRERPYAYVYRNWVIDSFNRDQPFDQFTIEQLAGDLLPNATLQEKIATGFHRNTLMNWEDGVDREEFRCKAKVDRVSTTGTVWLGLTLGCAECHSHKYDPISQREFYQLYAFFNNVEEADIPAQQPKDKDAKAQTFVTSTNCSKTFVHVRGDFLRHGEEVQPGVLAMVHPFKPRTANPDRLDLARWIVDSANPLTARVAMNHFWQHLFGRGLVNTPEDFGVRGERPSHPELLDWLATEFIRCGWSRKQMIKLIVTSATYRQSSHMRSELTERDPQNILLARQNRFRLESEIVRDVYLAAGDLLNPDIGGRSFRPNLPEDIKAFGGVGGVTWTDAAGPEKYRRGLYIYAQRTVPYPVSMAFDQANPSETCPRREQSNTPLQALTLLNHGIFVECAQGLGRRMLAEPAVGPREKIALGLRLCLGRKPTAQELARLETLYEDELRLMRNEPAAAGKLLGTIRTSATPVAETAAMTAVGQIMLSLDEFITRE